MTWKARLRSRLLPAVPAPVSDGTEGIAAVLIPIFFNPESGRDEILLTKRTMDVHTHKGQIGFPGGYWEKTDADLLQTALREAHEEIGVPPANWEILGRLNSLRTYQGGVLVYPFLGTLTLPFSFALNSAEVAQLIYLPLERLLNEGLQPVSVAIEKINIQSIGISVDPEHLIWGASARMLEEVHQYLK
jgi:8-oxo-dGTP pyrophosphatase MutT (NUDIX family)